ncbi:hypothetical protein CQW35_02884 [Bacteroides fragilis]|nr:hypothetical protein CQW35_02884 [Bacteroides fragilis]
MIQAGRGKATYFSRLVYFFCHCSNLIQSISCQVMKRIVVVLLDITDIYVDVQRGIVDIP